MNASAKRRAAKTAAAKTAAERKAAERARHKAAGRVMVQIWIHPEDRIRLARCVARIHRLRNRAS